MYKMSISLGIIPNFSGDYTVYSDADLLAYPHEILLKSANCDAAIYGVADR
jgi:hypothetical protein